MSAECDVNTETKFLKLLVKCPSERAEKFIHQAIDAFCGQKAPVYGDYSEIWTLYEWWDVIKSSQDFLKTVKSTDTEIKDIISTLPTEFQKIIIESLDVRSEALKNALVDKSHQVSSAYLKDFDWKLKMTLASDKLAQINESRLALDLEIQDGAQTKVLSLDMSKQELKSLIDSLEEANKAVSDLKI